MIVMVLAISS